MADNRILFKRLTAAARMPTKATSGAAGFDLYSTEDVFVEGGMGTVVIPTGISVRLPLGTYGRVAMRSGLARDQHLNVTGGVIDRDYKGEIGVLVFCSKTLDGGHTYCIKKGERIAQIIIEKIYDGEAEELIEADDISIYDHKGYGSTGKF